MHAESICRGDIDRTFPVLTAYAYTPSQADIVKSDLTLTEVGKRCMSDNDTSRLNR